MASSVELLANRYRVTETLVDGGLTVLVQCHDEKHDRPITIERLLASNAPASELIALTRCYEQMGRTLEDLSHTGIPACSKRSTTMAQPSSTRTSKRAPSKST